MSYTKSRLLEEIRKFSVHIITSCFYPTSETTYKKQDFYAHLTQILNLPSSLTVNYSSSKGDRKQQDELYPY